MKLILIQPNFIPNLFILNFQLNNSELGTAQPQLVLINVIMLVGSQNLFTTHSGKEEVSQIFTQSRFITLMTTHFEQDMVIQTQDF